MDYIIKSCDLQKVKIAGRIYAYVSRSCDLPKKKFLMAYINILGEHFLKNYQKRKFDGLHKQIMWPTKKWKWELLIKQVMWLTKKGNFDGWLSILGRHFPKNYQKRKFDGWHNQVMWRKKRKLQGGLGTYLSRSCDLPKKEVLMAYISGHVTHLM